MRTSVGLALCMLALVPVATTSALDVVPEDFAHRVEGGWLPELCVRPGDPGVLQPLTRDWARLRAGDRVRALFICSSYHQFEALSLARSFDLDCDIVPLWLSYSWRENDQDPDTMNLLRYDLGTRHYDVIAMASAWLSVLPDDCETKIAELIQKDGVGFVYAMPGLFPRVPSMQGKPSPILDPLMPVVLDGTGYKTMTQKAIPEGTHPLSKGSNFAQMRWVCNVDASASPGAMVLVRSEQPNRVLAAAATRGKGRLVAYNRCFGEYTYGYPFLPVADTSAPEEEAGKQCRWLQGMEFADQFYGWLGRALLWAARQEPPVALQRVTVNVKEGTVSVEAANSSEGQRGYLLRGMVRSPFGTVTRPLEAKWVLPAGKLEARKLLLPDTGYVGRHLIDLVLLDEDGKVVDRSSGGYEREGKLSAQLDPDFTLHSSTDTLRVMISVTGLAAKVPFTIRLELFDLEGRLLMDKTSRRNAPNALLLKLVETVPLGLTGTSTRLANLRVTVSAGGESTEARDQLFVAQDPGWDTFHIMAYAGHEAYALPEFDVLAQALKRMGHDTLLAGWPSPLKMRLNTETGMRAVVNNIAPFCGYDTERLRAMTRWLRRFSPVLYELQDEPELQVTPAVEARFTSPKDLERFRDWLKEKRKTLGNLNAAWATTYEKWEDVQRFLWHEVADTDNWTPWFDSRRDLDHSFVELFGTCSDAIREVEPQRLCNINPRAIETFSGVNLRDFTRRLQASSLYCNFIARPPMGYLELASRWVQLAQSCIGYSWPSAPNAAGITREAWDATRHGVKNLTWFAPLCDETPPHGRFSYFNADWTLNEKGQAIEKVNRQLLAGPGQVAAATEPLREGILVYYPRTLFYAHTLAHVKRQQEANPKLKPAETPGIGPWMEMLPSSFVPPLRALGFQFEFGDEEDLTAERLKATKAVFLSHVICLGQRELDLLLAFAGEGGCVIAEAGTGRRDEDGRLYAKTPEAFRQLFGVERVTPNPSPVVGKDGMVACGAEAVTLDPPLSAPTYRKGKAFFIDTRLPSGREGYFAVKQLLDLAGVKPAYGLSGNLKDDELTASLFVRQRGELTYLYVTGDGKEGPYSIELPKEQYVYEMVAGKDLGPRSRLEDAIGLGQARVFALSPYPISRFTASPSARRYHLGETVSVGFALATKTGQVGDRVVRLDYRTQKEGIAPFIPRTLLLRNGQGELRTMLPLNSVTGTARIVATDLTSGAQCETAFEVLTARQEADGRS